MALNELAEENARVRTLEFHMQQQLMEVDRAKSEFVSNVSHELRTPLTSISGYLELLEESLQDQSDANQADAQAEMLAIAQRNVGRLRDLIEDLLALSSAERLSELLDRVDVLSLIDAVVKDLRFSAGAVASRSPSTRFRTGRGPSYSTTQRRCTAPSSTWWRTP